MSMLEHRLEWTASAHKQDQIAAKVIILLYTEITQRMLHNNIPPSFRLIQLMIHSLQCSITATTATAIGFSNDSKVISSRYNSKDIVRMMQRNQQILDMICSLIGHIMMIYKQILEKPVNLTTTSVPFIRSFSNDIAMDNSSTKGTKYEFYGTSTRYVFNCFDCIDRYSFCCIIKSIKTCLWT